MRILVGTGNPAMDIPAVQTAVNNGDVILKGHFSFNGPPGATIQTALANYPLATVLVSKPVTISGESDASIEGGSIPFYVEAPGASVTIQGLRFCLPVAEAILVYAAHGLMIANCKIDGVVPVSAFGSRGIEIDTVGVVPTLAQQGHPEKIFGGLLITNNEIDVRGGTDADNTIGILVFSVGHSPDNEADIYVYRNTIKNTTQPAINLRLIGGRAYVEENVINTGPVSAQGATRPEVIRVANTGSYVIAHNTIDCEWAAPQAMGIGVFSQISAWIIEHAVVMNNSVTMSPPPGVIFEEFSAGIDIRGFANDNVVANNKIRGRSKAALSVDFFQGGAPVNNAFINNDLNGFAASSADTYIGQNVIDTRLLGQKGTIEDHGVGTIIVP